MSDPVSESVPSRGPTGKTIIPRGRLNLAENLYLAGWSRPRIERRLVKDFGVTDRTARRYIARVEAKLAALPKPSPDATFRRVEAMLLDTFRVARNGVRRIVVSQGKGLPSQVEAFPEANTGVMATVTWRLAELYGVVAPQKVDVTSGGAQLACVVVLPPLDAPMPQLADGAPSDPAGDD